MSEKFESIIKEYCKLHDKSADHYLTFIAKLDLPSGNTFIKRVVTELVADLEYGDSKFQWFANSDTFQDVKDTLKDLKVILSSYSDNFFDADFKVTKYQLGALLVFRRNKLHGPIRDIFIVLRLFCLNLCLQAQGRELSSALRIATDLRTDFSKLTGRDSKYIDIYTEKNSFINVLSKHNRNLWSLQENFLLWIKDGVFYTIKKSTSGSRKINTGDSANTILPERIRNNTGGYFGFQLINFGEIDALSDVSLSVSTCSDTEICREEPDNLTEVYQAVASEKHPISADGLTALAFAGCRLLTFQRLFLSLRNSVLDEKERQHFVVELRNRLISDDLKTRVLAIKLSLVFLLAKKTDEVALLKISKIEEPDADLNLISKSWKRQSIQMPSAVVPKSNSEFLNEFTEFCVLPLPDLLIDALNSVMSHESCRFSDVQKSVNLSDDDTFSLLKEIFSDFPRRHTPQQIRATAFDYIAKQYDPGFAALMFANTEFCLPTSLYYKSASVSALANSYKDMLVEFGFSVSAVDDFSNQASTGSQLALDDDALAKLFSDIFDYLEKLRIRSLASEQESILYFNNLSCYFVLVLIAATGHRTRQQFQFEPSHISVDNKLILLADKLCFDEAAVRFVPLASIAIDVFATFAKTARRLSENILNPDVRQHLRQKEFWQDGLDEPFFTQVVGDKYQVVTAQDIQQFLKLFGFELPLNSFRHRLSSRLSELNAHDGSQWFLGHIAGGEHPLNMLSAMSMSDISKFSGCMDEAIAPLKIMIPSALKTNGLTFVTPKAFSSAYIPPYLSVEYMNDRQRVRWCRDIYRSFSDEEQPFAIDIHEKIIGAVTKLENNADRHACQKLLFRMHERKVFGQELPVFQKWRGLINERLVVIPTDLFVKEREVKVLMTLLLQKLKEALSSEEGITLNHIILSLILNSSRFYQSYSFVLSLQKNLSVVGDILYFHYLDKNRTYLQILDPLTVALVQRAPLSWSSTNFTERSFIGFIARISGERVSASSFSNFTQLVSTYHLDPEEPSCLRAHRMGEFSTTPICDTALVRLFTDDLYTVCHQFDKPAAQILKKFRSSLGEPQLKDEFRFFAFFLKRVKDAFSRQVKVDTEFKQVIPKLWQELVGSKSADLSDLIDSSTSLSDIAISVLIFMTNVGKRRGSGRDNVSYYTVDTYFNKICRPLLDVAGAECVFDYDSDELVELYQKIFENRELKTEARHVSILKDFHSTVTKSIQLAEIDWSEIRVDQEEAELRFSELCTYKDYTLALDLLSKDPFASSTERVIQQSILIMACRFGLRRREIQHILREDLDFGHDTLNVTTNQYYRVKTPAGNRRLPASLLLNENEISILEALKLIAVKIEPSASARLFPVPQKLFFKLVDRVTESLQLVTSNDRFRLYDCRHSFISHMVLAALAPEKGRLNSISSAWLRCSVPSFRQLWLERTAGQFSQNNKLLHTIALVAGHTTAKTTITHYSHLMECLSFDYQMATLYQTKAEFASFLMKIGMNNFAARKFLDRSQNSLALSVTEKLVNKQQIGSSLALLARAEVELSERESTSSNVWFENSLDVLHQIRRLAVGKVSSDTVIVDHLLSSEMFIKWAFLSLSNSKIAVSEKKQLSSRFSKALNHRTIIDVLTAVSAKEAVVRAELFKLIKVGFGGLSRYFYEISEIDRISEVADEFGFSTAIGDVCDYRLSNVTRHGCHVSFSKNDIDIDYQLFLIALTDELMKNEDAFQEYGGMA